MSGHRTIATTTRDAILGAVVVVLAFALGAFAADIQAKDSTSLAGPALQRSATGANPVITPGVGFRSERTQGPHRLIPTGGVVARAPVPAAAPAPPKTIPTERFFGEAGGRQDRLAARDPYSRRDFILTTASLMHRRGWIQQQLNAADMFSPNLGEQPPPGGFRPR